MFKSVRKILLINYVAYALLVFGVIGLGFWGGMRADIPLITNGQAPLQMCTSGCAAADLKSSLFQLQYHLGQVSWVANQPVKLQQLRMEADGIARNARLDLATLKKMAGNGPNRSAELERALDQWDLLRAEIFSAAERRDMNTAEKLLRSASAMKLAEMLPFVDSFRLPEVIPPAMEAAEIAFVPQQMVNQWRALVLVFSLLFLLASSALLVIIFVLSKPSVEGVSNKLGA